TGVVRHASVAHSRLKLPTRIGLHLPASNPPFPPELARNSLARSAIAHCRPSGESPGRRATRSQGTSWIVPHAWKRFFHLGVRPNDEAAGRRARGLTTAGSCAGRTAGVTALTGGGPPGPSFQAAWSGWRDRDAPAQLRLGGWGNLRARLDVVAKG